MEQKRAEDGKIPPIPGFKQQVTQTSVSYCKA